VPGRFLNYLPVLADINAEPIVRDIVYFYLHNAVSLPVAMASSAFGGGTLPLNLKLYKILSAIVNNFQRLSSLLKIAGTGP